MLACDAGCGICMQAGVRIDLVVGDFDSVTDEALDYARACGAEFLTFPADKDETDLELALLYCKGDCKSKEAAGMLDDRSYSVVMYGREAQEMIVSRIPEMLSGRRKAPGPGGERANNSGVERSEGFLSDPGIPSDPVDRAYQRLGSAIIGE